MKNSGFKNQLEKLYWQKNYQFWAWQNNVYFFQNPKLLGISKPVLQKMSAKMDTIHVIPNLKFVLTPLKDMIVFVAKGIKRMNLVFANPNAHRYCTKYIGFTNEIQWFELQILEMGLLHTMPESLTRLKNLIEFRNIFKD